MESTEKTKRPPLTPEQRQRRSERARLLESLVYEMWEGKPVYYAGYRDVLGGTKKIEQVMSSSIQQGILVARLVGHLLNLIDRETYVVATNEIGVQFEKGDWRACDVAIFDLATLEGQDETKYAWVPPKIVIEVDTKADMSNFDLPFDYFQEKTTKLLDFGVKKVIWLFTKSRKVWIAEPGQDWVIRDWNVPVTVMPGCSVNLDELMPPKP